MKRSVLILIALLALSSIPAFAEDSAMDPQEMQDGERGDHQGMMGKMKMKGMHQQPTMIATSDGGVVVLAGPKLLKYDAQLNLVGEVELKMGPKPPQGEGSDEQPTQD